MNRKESIPPQHHDMFNPPSVGRQEHSPIETRARRGFSVLWDQVLVLCSGQELGPIADNGQEHGTISDLIIV
ncbi:hypothetical protein [Paenibacillus sp. FSL R7-0273]|uniref:hypothetical protein n=1 Tax=Paenibacillus sp. FSL R7-0273 TaxID=1536772 RepID=UPI00118006B1|nr:hypothetical protein [Paenibacillus sp. FSL R7-0273]